MTEDTSVASPDKDLQDLEIKDAQIIFEQVWSEIIKELGIQRMQFPSEIFWINGAPGAGKGTHTDTIMEDRDFTGNPIVISDLLNSPEAQKRKDAGLLVGDTEVCTLLLKDLLDPIHESGVIVDGFPRTLVQVQFLKLFYSKLNEISSQSMTLSGVRKIRKPNFHILVLFVGEEESVKRQLLRGQKALVHNKEVEASGIGKLMPVRETDFDEEKARNRYKLFKERTYEPLITLREIFHFHFVNTEYDIERVRHNILKELEYQSSLELSQESFEVLSQIPLANEIVVHARQRLIQRLDDYMSTDPILFKRIVKMVQVKFMPIIEKHAISGRAHINTEDSVFENEQAMAMLIDVFSERGYHASVDLHLVEIPYKIDTETNEILTRIKRVYRMAITFAGSEIRRGH